MAQERPYKGAPRLPTLFFIHRPFTFRVNCSCSLIKMCVHPVQYTIWHIVIRLVVSSEELLGVSVAINRIRFIGVWQHDSDKGLIWLER